jgi:hypothetical protein
MRTLGLCLLLFFTSCTDQGYMDSIENGYQLYYDQHMVDLLDASNTLMVRDIAGYKMSDSFILVYRKAADRQLNIIDGDLDWLKKHPTDPMQYWIVHISKDSAVGPFIYSEYVNQRAILKVDTSLVLRVGIDTVSRELH